MASKPNNPQYVAKLRRLAHGHKRTLIVLQNNPDPDAIASAAALKLLLKEIAGVARVERRDMTITFELTGDDEVAAELLSRIAAAGYRIAKFSPEEIDLEHVYRKASAGNHT